MFIVNCLYEENLCIQKDIYDGFINKAKKSFNELYMFEKLENLNVLRIQFKKFI